MPFDGTPLPEQSLEERALRYADAFFTGPEKWVQCYNVHGNRLCVGMALLRGVGAKGCMKWDEAKREQEQIAERALGVDQAIISWNDIVCTNFAFLKAHLRTRIKHYEDLRLKVLA